MCVGYFQGTDPLILTKLNAKGVGTLPLGNPWDSHGKKADLIKKEDNVRVVIGYLHKILPVSADDPIGPYELLYSCKTHSIPVLIIAPPNCKDICEKLLGQAAEIVTLVTPETLEEELDKIMG
ncbi:MAG: hypothetical protein ACXADX_09600 [Candidatus Hodarchaeales archaeon]|jgi:hypothetical protein